MVYKMEPCTPVPLPPAQLHDLVEKAKDYALINGNCMRQRNCIDRDAIHFVPFTLLPTPFPRQEFMRAVHLQPLLQELFYKLSHDDAFLRETFMHTVKADEYTRRVFDIYDAVMKSGGPAQDIELGIIRSDYFYCCASKGIKQVEINTMAASFGSLTSGIVPQHRYILHEAGLSHLAEHVPDNNARGGLAWVLAEGWRLYANPAAVILFVVEDVTFNIADQKGQELEVRRQCPGARVVRRSMAEIARSGHLTQEKGLIIDNMEVAVVYWRCGYTAEHFKSERDWEVRKMLELSRAIKCPNINSQLAGFKKVQQVLAVPGVLERFIKDKQALEAVRSCFTGLYSLDNNEDGNRNTEMATKNPERFVLKPQREGGGNNIYGEDIRPFLAKVKSPVERSQYILMDLIHPPTTSNYIVRPGKQPELSACLSELGIYGIFVADKKGLKMNSYIGQMLRTKQSNCNEGGVAAGFGSLDSLFLVDKLPSH